MPLHPRLASGLSALVCRRPFPFFDHLTIAELRRLAVLYSAKRETLRPYELIELRELYQKRKASGLG